MNASPTSAPRRAAMIYPTIPTIRIPTGSDPDADADAPDPRRLDWGPGSSAFNRVAGDGAAAGRREE